MAAAEDKVDDKAAIPEDDVEMGFFDHLAELRVRLMRACYGLVPGVVIGGIFREELLSWLLAPLERAWANALAAGVELPSDTPELTIITPYDVVVIYLFVMFIAGLLLGAPWVFYQVWLFIAPGLYRREKRYAIPFIAASTVCFVGGAMFAYWVVFPFVFEWFLSLGGTLPGGVTLNQHYSVDALFTMELKLLVAFGVVFEVPVVTSFLAALGVVDWKQLLKFSRWWVLIASLIASVLTPPDPGSMLMMLVPMIGMWFVSVLAAYLIRRKPKSDASTDALKLSDE